jgi:type IV pilus assembly protein PilZ
MPDNSFYVFKRIKKQCPQCRETIPDAYVEQNPFPEFPCPACGGLIDASSLKDLEFLAEDERTEERFDETLKVSYNSYYDFITEYTSNVGKGGIFINTKRHHEINKTVDLFLEVPGLAKPLKIEGEVVHIEIQNVPDEDAGIGVKFVDIDRESRKALIDFIKLQ